jgi:phosphopantothenoylcysteine decarboxylase/phosphopantothenate--cysteine ligase
MKRKRSRKPPRHREIVLGVTGSIAAYKACDIINRLRDAGFNVTVVMTEEAAHFISPLTLQNLSGNKVIKDMYGLPDNYDPLHTSLSDKADLILIAPATANIIGKIASGICDDILSCIILATNAPVLIAPAMNDRMYKHKSVERNIDILKGWGYKFIGPEVGRLVCGYRAVGHLAGIDAVINEVKKVLK